MGFDGSHPAAVHTTSRRHTIDEYSFQEDIRNARINLAAGHTPWPRRKLFIECDTIPESATGAREMMIDTFGWELPPQPEFEPVDGQPAGTYWVKLPLALEATIQVIGPDSSGGSIDTHGYWYAEWRQTWGTTYQQVTEVRLGDSNCSPSCGHCARTALAQP